jgi:hypothetical protein
MVRENVFRGFSFGHVRDSHSCDAKLLKHTPLFVETIFCLVLIMGEPAESGRIPCFAIFAIGCIIPVFLNDFQAKK